MVHLTADDVAELLGTWSSSRGALHRHLAEGIRACIESGSLPAGSRLPSERALANALAISRSTVTAAYESLCGAEFLEKRRGSGSYVASRKLPHWLDVRPLVVARRAATGGLLEPSHVEPVNFTSAAPVDADVLTDAALERGANEARTVVPGDGYLALGLPSLRDAIAAHLSQSGLPTHRDEVLITTGAQEAVFLLARLLVDAGAIVAIEDPTWFGAIDAFRSFGARLHSVGIDEDGVRTSLLQPVLEHHAVRAVFVSPSVNNPTGAILSEARRSELCRLARDNGALVIEDNSLVDLVPGEHLPLPVAAHDREVSVVTIGSLSKLFWGGLRIGWIRAEPRLITRLAHWKLIVNSGTSIVSQGIAAHLLEQVDAIKARRHELIRANLDVVTAALLTDAPEFRWRRPLGGWTIWVRMPSGTAAEFSQVALRHGVAIVPGSMSSSTSDFANYFRLPFVLPAPIIREGIRRLGEAWSLYRRMANKVEPSVIG